MSISFSFSLFQSNGDCLRAMITKQKQCTTDNCDESCCMSGCRPFKIGRSMCTCMMDFASRSETIERGEEFFDDKDHAIDQYYL